MSAAYVRSAFKQRLTNDEATAQFTKVCLPLDA